jgi:hypothetical protein
LSDVTSDFQEAENWTGNSTSDNMQENKCNQQVNVSYSKASTTTFIDIKINRNRLLIENNVTVWYEYHAVTSSGRDGRRKLYK